MRYIVITPIRDLSLNIVGVTRVIEIMSGGGRTNYLLLEDDSGSLLIESDGTPINL